MDTTRGTPLVMRSDGTRRRVVDLEPAGHPWAASPSPDGRSFAYNLPTRSSEMSAPAEIWRARLDGTRARHIGDGWMPRWSPDGRSIAFASPNGLSVMDARRGGQVRVLVPGFQAHSLDWSPDGRRLAFTGCCPYAVWTVSVNGSQPPRHRVFPQGRHSNLIVYGVVWSPDGKQFAFGRSRYDDELADYSIWTMTTGGTRLRKIRSSGFVDSELNTEPVLSWGPR